MSLIDVVIIGVYIAGCLAMGAYLGESTQGLKGYFLGERNVPAWAVMLSIVATETSTATFLSVPGVAYAAGGGFTYLQLPLGYLVGRVIVALFLLPAYFRGEIYTAYQVLRERFGGWVQTTASVLFLVARTLGDGLRLFLAATVLRELFAMSGMFHPERGTIPEAWSMPLAIAVMGVSTLIYTYLGGMKAVVWTDVVQFGIYILGALAALVLLLREIPGGWDELVRVGSEAGKFRMFDFGLDLTRPFTFWAGVIGGMVLNTATHGADQLMVQRYLSARSERQAAWALVTSGVVVFAQFGLFLVIGIGLYTLHQAKPPAVLPGKDREFASFLVQYMPPGLLGLVIAAIFAAAMSTLSSSLNASASTTVNDLIRPLRRRATDEEAEDRSLLRLSKALTVVWGVAQMGVALLATYLMKDNAVNAALAIASFVTGIVLGLFILGIGTERVGQRAALTGLLVGLGVVSYAQFGPLLKGVMVPLPRVGLSPFSVAIEPTSLYPFAGNLAWPWFALVGSTTVVVVGLLASAGRGRVDSSLRTVS